MQRKLPPPVTPTVRGRIRAPLTQTANSGGSNAQSARLPSPRVATRVSRPPGSATQRRTSPLPTSRRLSRNLPTARNTGPPPTTARPTTTRQVATTAAATGTASGASYSRQPTRQSTPVNSRRPPSRNSSSGSRRTRRPLSRGSSTESQGSHGSGHSSSRGTRHRIRSRRVGSPRTPGRPRTRQQRFASAAVNSTTPLIRESRVSMTASSSNQTEVTVGQSRSRSPMRRRRRSKSRVSFVLPDPSTLKSSMKQFIESEKCLKQMFHNFNWNELLVLRKVCKNWLLVISSEPKLHESSVIAVRKDFDALKIFNESLIIWTKFRFYSALLIDLTQPIQNEFWKKHGASMTFLELRSPCLTLSGFVGVLTHCPNLTHFLVAWTPEMYAFNPELIKKYYGVSIKNGTFARITSLTIEKSAFLTDQALLTVLKWCGSSLVNLSLTCSPEDIDENSTSALIRLKPRWTMEPIDAFTNRFSYAKNLKFLDFFGSNLSPSDLTQLANMEKLVHLTGIRLSRCKVNDESTLEFLMKKGARLEQLYLDYTPITDKLFNFKSNKDLNLKKLLTLDISGTHNFRSLNFLPELVDLEDFRCAQTGWLNYSMLSKPIESHGMSKKLKKVNFSHAEKSISKNFDADQRSAWFLHFCTILRKLSELTLDWWSTFGTDENFKTLCLNIPNLRKLRVRGWSNLTDEGVTGFTFEQLVEMEDSEKDIWKNTQTRLQNQSLARLKNLHLLDFGGCLKLTDVSIQFGILYLPNLRMLSLDGSQVSDVGIHVLIAKCKTLDKLSILACDQTTPKGKRINRLDGRAVSFGPIRLNRFLS